MSGNNGKWGKEMRRACCVAHVIWPCVALAGVMLLAGPPERRASGFEESQDALATTVDVNVVADLLELTLQTDPQVAAQSLTAVREKILAGDLAGDALQSLRRRLEPLLDAPLRNPGHAAHHSAILLSAVWGDRAALEKLLAWLPDPQLPDEVRGDAVRVVLSKKNPPPLSAVLALVVADQAPMSLRVRVLDELQRLPHDEVARQLVAAYPGLPGELQARSVELLCQRPAWTRILLEAVHAGKISKDVLHAQQLVRLQLSGDAELKDELRKIYGNIRAERSVEREAVIRQVRQFVMTHPGNPFRGAEIFRRLCAQCHRIYGEGQDVGPDITRNGRASFQQLLSNVLDPNLVVGEAYQPRIVVTGDGRVLTGLLAEETPHHITLKLQGGKLEKIAKQDVEIIQSSPLSLMPEGLEKQLSLEELADLFSFLRLDGPPADPAARLIPD